MPLHKLLVEMLHREIAIALAVKLLHTIELTRWRSPRRDFANPPIAQALDPVLLVAVTQPAEITPRHPQQLSGFLGGEPMTSVLLKRFLKTRHKHLP